LVSCKNCGKELSENELFCSACGCRTNRGEEEGVSIPEDRFPQWEEKIEAVVSRAVKTIEDTVNSAMQEMQTRSWGSDRYRVEEQRSLGGAVGTDRLYLEVESKNGLIQVSTWDKPEFKIDLLMKAYGYTQQEAEENLKALKEDFSEETIEGQKRLSLKFIYPIVRRGVSVQVDVTLPSSVIAELDLKASNGSINLSKVLGSNLVLRTSNGKMILDNITADKIDGKTSNGRISLNTVYAESLSMKTSNGKIEGELKSQDVYLETSNGKIDLDLPCVESGEYQMHTSNGKIEIDVPDDPNIGYDLDLRTSMSKININLSNLEYLQRDRRYTKAQTQGFEDKEKEITIKADTSRGRIRINS
jgi:hypothetical protein